MQEIINQKNRKTQRLRRLLMSHTIPVPVRTDAAFSCVRWFQCVSGFCSATVLHNYCTTTTDCCGVKLYVDSEMCCRTRTYVELAGLVSPSA